MGLWEKIDGGGNEDSLRNCCNQAFKKDGWHAQHRIARVFSAESFQKGKILKEPTIPGRQSSDSSMKKRDKITQERNSGEKEGGRGKIFWRNARYLVIETGFERGEALTGLGKIPAGLLEKASNHRG